jgi:hypothetical protein
MKYHDDNTGADAQLFDDGTLFVFGTWGRTDILQDLKVWPTIRKGIIGHRGSYEQARFLLNAIGRDWEKVTEIHGHSLGGSVALFLGLWTKIFVKTYGAFNPFVWWWKLEDIPNCINYIYGCDIVPRIFWWRKKYGITVRLKGKGFHPFRDHISYRKLIDFGVNGIYVE